MKKILTLSMLLLYSNFSFSQKEKIEKEWVKKDTIFISQIAKASKESTNKLIEILNVEIHEKIDLGFDYQMIEASNGKGYISFQYKVLFFKNEVVAYELKLMGEIPERYKGMRQLYKNKLSKIFRIDAEYNISPITFGFKIASEPLSDLDFIARKDLEKVMNPFIGIEYGNRCGIDGHIIYNRATFDKIINSKNCEVLMYSKNPAIRIMAIEFFYCNLSKFDDLEIQKIELRIEVIKKQSPVTFTCSGCIYSRENTENIVMRLKDCK